MTIKNADTAPKREGFSLRRETLKNVNVRTSIKTGTCFNTCGIQSCGSTGTHRPRSCGLTIE
jgi:hypothetical protein